MTRFAPDHGMISSIHSSIKDVIFEQLFSSLWPILISLVIAIAASVLAWFLSLLSNGRLDLSRGQRDAETSTYILPPFIQRLGLIGGIVLHNS